MLWNRCVSIHVHIWHERPLINEKHIKIPGFLCFGQKKNHVVESNKAADVYVASKRDYSITSALHWLTMFCISLIKKEISWKQPYFLCPISFCPRIQSLKWTKKLIWETVNIIHNSKLTIKTVRFGINYVWSSLLVSSFSRQHLSALFK